MNSAPDTDEIRSEPAPACPLCGSEGGGVLYRGLKDRLFGAPGSWSMKRCRNEDCGSLWLDPMPIKEDISKAYTTYYTHEDTDDNFLAPIIGRRLIRFVRDGYLSRKYGHDAESVSTVQRWLGLLAYIAPTKRAALDFRVMYLPAQPQARLLEVGFGSGQTLLNLAGRGWDVEGVEVDPVSVRRAQSKGLNVRLGNLQEQQYPDNHFDAVIMSHVIEHVHEPLSLVRECHRILKSRGRLVAVTPNAESWGHHLYHEAWLALDPPRHLHIFTRRALGRLASMADFGTVRIKTTNRDSAQTFAASSSIRRSGHYSRPSASQGFLPVWARMLQLAEWALLQFNPNLGEEIVLTGEK